MFCIIKFSNAFKKFLVKHQIIFMAKFRSQTGQPVFAERSDILEPVRPGEIWLCSLQQSLVYSFVFKFSSSATLPTDSHCHRPRSLTKPMCISTWCVQKIMSDGMKLFRTLAEERERRKKIILRAEIGCLVTFRDCVSWENIATRQVCPFEFIYLACCGCTVPGAITKEVRDKCDLPFIEGRTTSVLSVYL